MNKPDEQYTLSYLTLRQAIGWIGLFMPIVVRLGAMVFEGISSTDSISAYYYTGMRDVFVSTLVLVGALLACYRTPEPRDTWAAIIVGLSAVGIALFPMDPVFADEIVRKYPDVVTKKCYLNKGIVGYHFIFVTTFFALAFYLVYFRFCALTPMRPTRQKLKRNKIYKICGLIMLASFVVIGVLAFANRGASIFWPEATAVISFAVAWLVKGQLVLRDGAV
jgi:hypothetical protein